MMDRRHMLTLGAAVLLICMITGCLLGAVNAATEEPLKAMEQEKILQAMETVMERPEESSLREVEITDAMQKVAAGKESRLVAVHRVLLDGQTTGYILQTETLGAGGNLGLMVGVSARNTVTGVAVLYERDLSGQGAGADSVLPDGTSLSEQFIGKTAADDLTVGCGVDATAGTVAVAESIADGVSAALTAVGTIR